MKMRANNVLVDPEMWTEQKIGAILLPDNQGAREKFARGTVIAVGPGLYLPGGEQIPIEVDVGDHILYFKAAAAEIVNQERPMHIVQEREILAILDPGEFNDEGATPDATD